MPAWRLELSSYRLRFRSGRFFQTSFGRSVRILVKLKRPDMLSRDFHRKSSAINPPHCGVCGVLNWSSRRLSQSLVAR